MKELPSPLRRLYTALLSRRARFRLENLIRGPYPRIYDRKKFIFIHIPKTAGKSLTRLLGTGGACHLSWHHYRRILGQKLDDYFVFTVVRDPLDRLISSYTYLAQGGNQSTDDLILKRTWVDSCETFDEFVRFSLPKPQVHELRKFRPQSSFLVDESGKLANITLLRFEHLPEDFAVIADRLGVPAQLPHVNASNRDNRDFGLSREAVAVVRDLYREDYRLLGYRPPEAE